MDNEGITKEAMIKQAQQDTWGVVLNDDVSTELRLKLARALNKKAMTKSAAAREKAVAWTTKVAFIQEMNQIDPEFAKLAWGLPSWSDVKSGISNAAGKVWGGVKSVGRWVKNNPLDAALTAAMFVPGLNVVGGLARAARVGYGAYRGARALQATRRAAQGLQGAARLGANMRGVGRAAKAGRHAFGRAAVNPFNREIGLAGARGTTMTGRIAAPGARTFGRGVGGQGASRFSSLSRGRKALRTGAVGLGVLDAASVPDMIVNTPFGNARRANQAPPLHPGIRGAYGGSQAARAIMGRQ